MKKDSQQNVSFYTFPELKVRNGFFGKEFLSNLSKESSYKKIKSVMKTDKMSLVDQVHSNTVKIVTEENYNSLFIGDGMLTNVKGIALATKVADCQAILLYDEEKQVIGNVHSGWKGTIKQILIEAIRLMKETYGCNVRNIKVYFCPSICQNCFEVKEDVAILFQDTFSFLPIASYIKYVEEKERYFIDTVGINKELLLREGVLPCNIIMSDLCTKCNPTLFHSYRLDKENSGRNLAVICL